MTGVRKGIKIANKIVNLTGHEIGMYDDFTGDIFTFAPVRGKALDDVFNGRIMSEENTYYVMECDKVGEFRTTGRPMDNIAIAIDGGIGNMGRHVTYLIWAKDKGIRVCLQAIPSHRRA